MYAIRSYYVVDGVPRRNLLHLVQQRAQPGGPLALGQLEEDQGRNVLGAVGRFGEQEAAVDG